MSDFLIIRIPFNKPDKPEIVKFLTNVPIHWKKYLKEVAKKEKKAGRYLVANLKYELDYFYPRNKEKAYKKTERKTEK
jgi:hypothetical protein